MVLPQIKLLSHIMNLTVLFKTKVVENNQVLKTYQNSVIKIKSKQICIPHSNVLSGLKIYKD